MWAGTLDEACHKSFGRWLLLISSGGLTLMHKGAIACNLTEYFEGPLLAGPGPGGQVTGGPLFALLRPTPTNNPQPA